jgi:hypothetical protein
LNAGTADGTSEQKTKEQNTNTTVKPNKQHWHDNMTSVYVKEDGEVFSKDEIQRKDMCFICGRLGETEDEDGFIDGGLPTISNETVSSRADVCRECLKDGLTEEQLEEAFRK